MSDQRSRFLQQLESSEQAVSLWPEWKRRAFGVIHDSAVVEAASVTPPDKVPRSTLRRE